MYDWLFREKNLFQQQGFINNDAKRADENVPKMCLTTKKATNKDCLLKQTVKNKFRLFFLELVRQLCLKKCFTFKNYMTHVFRMCAWACWSMRRTTFYWLNCFLLFHRCIKRTHFFNWVKQFHKATLIFNESYSRNQRNGRNLKIFK